MSDDVQIKETINQIRNAMIYDVYHVDYPYCETMRAQTNYKALCPEKIHQFLEERYGID